MAAELGSLILFSERVEDVAAFYRALGLPLESEQHGDGPVHHTCSLGPTHFAIFAARSSASAAQTADHRGAGAQFFGLTVDDLGAAFAVSREHGAEVVQEPKSYPWGRRALVRDPDGRVVELFERPRDGR
jgi:lactoylglutathione lyase